jgi:hypothetical protein
MNNKCPHCQVSCKQNVYAFFYENNTANIVKSTNCRYTHSFYKRNTTEDLYSTHAYAAV